jgi:hypothetical protein
MTGYIVLFASVLLGAVSVILFKPQSKVISVLLTFSGAYLLSIMFLKFLPNLYSKGVENIGIFILLGLIIQLSIEFLIKGHKHKHYHGHLHHEGEKHFPISLLMGLNLHAFVEGMPLADHQQHHLLWAIALHHFPMAMVLASVMIFSEWNKIWVLFFTLLFGFMTPFGALVGGSVSFLIDYSVYVNALIAGVLLHISTIILFESSQEYKFNFVKFLSVLVGIVLAMLV